LRILGISAFYHDSAAALIEDGVVIAAAQEERFTRKKHDDRFPESAIHYCLDEAGISLADIDFVAFYDKPFLKFERLLETYLAFAPHGFRSFRMAIPIWLKEKLFQKDLLSKKFKAFDADFDWQNKLLFSEHHQSHAASAFFPSPFEKAVVSANGPPHRLPSVTVQISRWFGKSIFPIPSDCCIRRSPITPVSRSIPASTRSWDWPLMVSLPSKT
jgi:carbamoyltransferase